MNHDERIAVEVGNRTRKKLYDGLGREGRRALRIWPNRACFYREPYPDADFDETRAAVRALRDVSRRRDLTPEQRREEADRALAAVHAEHTSNRNDQ